MRRLTWLLVASACGGGSQGGTSAPPPQAAPAPRASSYEGDVRAARSYVESGRPERGAAIAERATQADPSRPEAWAAWGLALASQGQLEVAVEKYEKARALGSTDRQTFVELSSVYDVQNQYDKSVGVYQAWLEGHPDDAEMWQELGLSQLLREDFAAAKAALAKAVALSPNDVQVRTDLGQALLRNHEPDAAAKELTEALRRAPDEPEPARLLAQAKAAQGKTDEARALLDKLVLANPNDERALRVRARLRQVDGDAKGALEDYVRVLKLAGEDAGALLGAAGALIELNRLDDAQKAVAAAQKLAGDLPEVRFRAAQLKLRRGQPGALAELTACAEALPDSIEAWREVLAAAKKAGDKALVDKSQKRLKQIGG